MSTETARNVELKFHTNEMQHVIDENCCCLLNLISLILNLKELTVQEGAQEKYF